ncbi:hypothetical protein PAE9249_03005 [Paenibacillus sp. CECT 9249]|nr:hypothetical protein PAE9249_03005 [Paenibacillus sp. CECT 9249]
MLYFMQDRSPLSQAGRHYSYQSEEPTIAKPPLVMSCKTWRGGSSFDIDYTTPCASIASATFKKPAMLAPTTKLPA